MNIEDVPNIKLVAEDYFAKRLYRDYWNGTNTRDGRELWNIWNDRVEQIAHVIRIITNNNINLVHQTLTEMGRKLNGEN